MRVVQERAFRRLVGQFATGVTVVTTGSVAHPQGITVNSLTSVSLRPPLVLICVDRSRESHDNLAAASHFGVSVLRREQRPAADHFAGRKDEESAAALQFFEGVTAVPLLVGSLAYLECRRVATYPGGDHSIFVAEVVHGEPGAEGEPLLFFGGAYRTVGERLEGSRALKHE